MMRTLGAGCVCVFVCVCVWRWGREEKMSSLLAASLRQSVQALRKNMGGSAAAREDARGEGRTGLASAEQRPQETVKRAAALDADEISEVSDDEARAAADGDSAHAKRRPSPRSQRSGPLDESDEGRACETAHAKEEDLLMAGGALSELVDKTMDGTVAVRASESASGDLVDESKPELVGAEDAVASETAPEGGAHDVVEFVRGSAGFEEAHEGKPLSRDVCMSDVVPGLSADKTAVQEGTTEAEHKDKGGPNAQQMKTKRLVEADEVVDVTVRPEEAGMHEAGVSTLSHSACAVKKHWRWRNIVSSGPWLTAGAVACGVLLVSIAVLSSRNHSDKDSENEQEGLAVVRDAQEPRHATLTLSRLRPF